MVRFRHAGIVVRDIQESLSFYKKLGFKVISDVLESGKFIDIILGYNKCEVRTIKMICNNKQMIELLYYTSPRSKDFTKKINSVGCSHIALTVEDIESLCAELRHDGVKFINPPAANEKVKVAFCKDPNDVYLELVEDL
jgi:catechol 2,3-dioxygenase-like lactoylglutathione lyase family enzyme